MPIEFFLPDRLVKQLISNYNSTDVNQNKGLLFTVDFVQDESTYTYGATGTVDITAGDVHAQSGAVPKIAETSLKMCPHPPPCG